MFIIHNHNDMLTLTYLFWDFTFLHGLDLVISVNVYQMMTFNKLIRNVLIRNMKLFQFHIKYFLMDRPVSKIK